MLQQSPVRAVPLVALFACSSGSGVKVVNEAPNVEITYPTDGLALESGVSVTMSGTGSDAESVETTLMATWMVDGEVLCDSVPLDPVGLTECVTSFETGSYTISLTITDELGEANTDTVSIMVQASNAPEVAIVAPLAGGVYYADQPTTLEGTVADEETAAADLQIAWQSSLDGDLSAASANGSGVTTDTLSLSEGEHTLTLTATDSDGLSGSDTVSISVLATNTPPSCGISAPLDGSFDDAGVTVDFVGEASDVDVDPTELYATWSSDRQGDLFAGAVTVAGETGFSTSTLDVGTHVITLTVVDDGGASCVDAIQYTVGSPPSATILMPGDGDIVNEGDLVEFLGEVSDNEDDGVDIEVSWTSSIDGALDATPPASGDPTVGFLTDELAPGEHEIRLRATDSDDLRADDIITLVVNGLPSAPALAIDPDPAYTASDLSVVITAASIDPEGHTISYAYDWTVDGVPSSVTSATVPASDTTRGQEWEVTVTPFDGFGLGTPASTSITIENSPPTVDSAPLLTPDPVYEGDSLVCTLSTTTDDDGDSVSSSTAWFVNGATVAATAGTLGSTFFDAGDSVYCEQTPYDGIENGTAVASNVVVVSNTAPTVSDVAISPDPATSSDSLTCSYTFADVDGDADASSIVWTVGGFTVGTGTTLSSGFVRGDTVVCTVTPNDGTDAGASDSASIVIQNSEPSISSVSVTPDPSVTADDYTCTVASSSDVDGDTVTYTYSWYVNGVSVGVASSTLSASFHVRNDTVYCRVVPNDGFTDGDAVDSNSVVTGNTAPVANSVTLSPSSPGTDMDITATVSTSDEDSDTVTVTYDWYVNAVFVGSSTTNVLDSSSFVRGDTVSVEVTPNDGTDDGSTLASSSVTIVNTLPEAPELVFDPVSPEQGIDSLYCEMTTASYDADGDTVTYTFSWTVDGVAYTGASTTAFTGDTVPAADTELGFDWICTATPNDGFGDGTAESILVTVRDVTDPDAPTIDTPERFRNEDDISLTGTCEFGDCVSVVVDCDSASLSQSTTVSCGSGDSWSASFTNLFRDETTLCTAYCVDASANESGDSNTVSTDVCAPFDTFEDTSGTGDSDAAAIEPFTAIAEGIAASIDGNILGSDTVDWYVLDSDDDVVADRAAGIDFYSLDIRLLDADTGAESSDYTMTVFKGSTATASCPTATSGYTAYTDYWYDRADGSHSAPSDRRSCAASSSVRNACEDMSQTYYVKVERVSASVTSCAGYELSVTNNGGVCNTTTECPF